MYKRISLALLLSYCAIQSAAAQQTLRFGVDPTFPPFESKASDGSLQGFDIDLGNAHLCPGQSELQMGSDWL